MGGYHISEIPLKMIHFLIHKLTNQRLDTKCSFVSHLRPLKPVFDAASLTELINSSFRKHKPGFLNYLLTPSLIVFGTSVTKSIRVLSYDKLARGFGIVWYSSS